MKQIVTKRRKEICQLIQDVYGSLESHFEGTWKKGHRCPTCGGQKHHVECIQEYAEQIKRLAEML